MKNKQYRGRAVRDYKSIGVKKGNWVYGYYWTNEAGNHFIRVTKLPSKIVLEDVEIEKSTLGKNIGIKDKIKMSIFEDDIVKVTDKNSSYYKIGLVRWFEKFGAFGLKFDQSFSHFVNINPDRFEIEVMNNRFEKPNLLSFLNELKDDYSFIYEIKLKKKKENGDDFYIQNREELIDAMDTVRRLSEEVFTEEEIDFEIEKIRELEREKIIDFHMFEKIMNFCKINVESEEKNRGEYI